MAAPKIFSGARAKVFITKPGQQPVLVGIFSSLSYNVNMDVQPAFILGRYAPAELDYTAMEPVSISASGWRVIGQGPHKAAAVPKLQDLLLHEYLSISVIDRATGSQVANLEFVRPTSYSASAIARQLSENSYSFLGILASDEDGPASYAEDGTASQLP